MRKLKCLIVLFLFSCENNTETIIVPSDEEGYPTVETVVANLDNDKIPDTIRLNYEPEYDPGEFTELTIEFSSLGHFHEKANEVWDNIPSEFKKSHRNAVKSSHIFVNRESETTFILLFGYPYPTGTCELSVICVDEGKVRLHQIEQFKEAKAFVDLDRNGTMELIGRNNYEIEQVNDNGDADLGTYSPFYVLSYVKNSHSESFQLDPKLTELYNTDNYVWKGMNYSEHIKILYPYDRGKPRLPD